MTDRVSEKQFQGAIIDAARALGWLVYHTHDSRRSEPGFPDLVMVRDRVLFVELKRHGGVLSREQRVWLARLEAAGAEVYCWTPEDWLSARSVLARAVAA